ncbi:MAG: hypothetical protein KKA19_01880 [Candidatus Margulisbacteria bacterium]|nr:hypothetical protein [Candidatus Margulisiibacteriota bacterium]
MSYWKIINLNIKQQQKLISREEFRDLLAQFLAGQNVQLQATEVITGNNGWIQFKYENDLIIFQTGLKNKTNIKIEPLYTSEFNLLLLLSDKNGNLIRVYQYQPSKNRFYSYWHLLRNIEINWIIAFLKGLPLAPKSCIIQTTKFGSIEFRINNKPIKLTTGLKKIQKIKIQPLQTKQNEWFFLLIDLKGKLLNAYQWFPKQMNFSPAWITKNPNKDVNWILAYLYGLPVKPQPGILYTSKNSYIYFFLNKICISVWTGLKENTPIHIKPLETKEYGWIIRLYTNENKHLYDYQLLPQHPKKIRKFYISYKHQLMQDLLQGNTNITPLPMMIKTTKDGTFIMQLNSKRYTLSTSLSGTHEIQIKPLWSKDLGWLFLLIDPKNNILLNVYQGDPQKSTLKCLFHASKNKVNLNWIRAYLLGIPVEPQTCVATTTANGSVSMGLYTQLLHTGLTGANQVYLQPLKTAAYGWILRIYDDQNRHLCDYKLHPFNENKFVQLNKNYQFQTILDYLHGKEISPIPCQITTNTKQEITFQLHGQRKSIYIGVASSLIHLIPKYTGNYSWLIEIWNEDKTKLLTTIDRRRL